MWTSEKDGPFCLCCQCLVEGCQKEAAPECERSEIGICPLLRRRGVTSQPPEVVFESRRLFKQADPPARNLSNACHASR